MELSASKRPRAVDASGVDEDNSPTKKTKNGSELATTTLEAASPTLVPPAGHATSAKNGTAMSSVAASSTAKSQVESTSSVPAPSRSGNGTAVRTSDRSSALMPA